MNQQALEAAAREVFNRSTEGTQTEVLAMVRIALIAAARVRLAKAEGEQ